MKRIQYHKYGGAETMQLETFELTAPKVGQVAVQVKAASINPIDWKVRRGELKMVTGKSFPRAMGADFSGTVLTVGPGVTRFKRGDHVFGLARLKECGAFADVVVTVESFVAIKPESVSFEQAACFGTPVVTAWNGLVDKAVIKPGQRVFVAGCMGSVGQAAAQLALRLGASVAGSCSANDASRAQALNIDPVFDYRALDLSTLKDDFDVIYDTSGAPAMNEGPHLVRRGGVFVDIHPTPTKFLRALFNSRLKVIICKPRAEILEEAARAAAAGQLQIAIGKTVGLTGAIELISDLEKGQKINGKGLIVMN